MKRFLLPQDKTNYDPEKEKIFIQHTIEVAEDGTERIVSKVCDHPLEKLKVSDFALKTLIRNNASELLKPSKPLEQSALHNARNIEESAEHLIHNKQYVAPKQPASPINEPSNPSE